MEFETDHGADIQDAQFDFYGSLIATASLDQTVKVFLLTNDSKLDLQTDLKGHKGPVFRVAWAHPKFGKILGSCGYARQVILWREESAGHWETLLQDDSFPGPVNAIQFAPSHLGLIFAVAGSDGFVSIFHFNTGRNQWVKKNVLVHNFSVNSLSFSPEGNESCFKMVTGGSDNLVRFWRLSTQNLEEAEEEKVATEKGHSDWVRSVSWAPSLCGGKEMAASCSLDGTAKVWGRGEERWEVEATIEMEKVPCSVVWSPLGDRLVVTDQDGEAHFYQSKSKGTWEKILFEEN